MIHEVKMVSNAYIKANIEEIKKLGEGVSGVVFLVKYKNDLACMKIGKRGLNQLDAFMEEARMLEKADGAGGVPKLLLVANDAPTLVTTYCPYPDLNDVMVNPVSQQHCIQIFRAVTKALDDLHRAGVSHNDFKDDNVLIDVNGPQAYIIDLGRSCHIGEAPESFKYKDPDRHKLFPFYDFHLWCGNIALPHSDVYSLGFTMQDTLEYIASTGRFIVDEDISCLFYSMIDADVEARPSMQQVLATLDKYLEAN